MIGRFWSWRISSSDSRPAAIGVRRTWKALVPITAPVMFSLTYEFIPWMIATTTTRKPTETMMPRSVKKERSLLWAIDWRASRSASA